MSEIIQHPRHTMSPSDEASEAREAEYKTKYEDLRRDLDLLTVVLDKSIDEENTDHLLFEEKFEKLLRDLVDWKPLLHAKKVSLVNHHLEQQEAWIRVLNKIEYYERISGAGADTQV